MLYLTAKMHQIQFQLGLCARRCWGSALFRLLLELDLEAANEKGEEEKLRQCYKLEKKRII